MDKAQRRLHKRVMKRLIALRPNFNHRNPTLEMEQAEAKWLLSPEGQELCKHVPRIYEKIRKHADWFLRHGHLYPLTKAVKHDHFQC